MAYDKNVFILGAGASVGAGAPVLNDFLKKARELLDNPKSPLESEERAAFKRVFEWRGRIYPVLRFLKIDLENIENLFSLVDMSYQLGLEDTEDARNDLIKLVSRALELTVKFSRYDYEGDRVTADRTYFSFVELLKEWAPKENGGKSEFDSIITLNYDIACDQAFHAQQVLFTYGDPWTKANNSGYKLLKLHGSINWGICSHPQCDYKKADMGFSYYTPIPGTDYSYMEPTQRIYSIRCEKCGRTLTPFIVPPTWNKVAYSEGLQSVWRSASEELEQAARLIIVGYSLPQTDSFFKYLLALGLSKNESLQEVILIDPARGTEGEAMENRYRDFIAPFFDIRNFKSWHVSFQQGISVLNNWRRSPELAWRTLQDYESNLSA